MKKDLFISQFVIAYVAQRMSLLNINEVQPANLTEKYTLIALREAEICYNIYSSQQSN